MKARTTQMTKYRAVRVAAEAACNRPYGHRSNHPRATSLSTWKRAGSATTTLPPRSS
jgi:hypothetical protein